MDSINLFYGNIFRDDTYVKKRVAQYYELIKPHLKEGIDILDIGGYMGDLYEYTKIKKISSQKINYSIVDYDDGALKIAKERGIDTYKINFNYEDIDKVIGNKKFDIIICTELLEHLLEPAKLIEKIQLFLNPDGICIVSLPNENTIFHRVFVIFGLGIDQCVFKLGKHLHFPTIAQSYRFVSKYMDIEKIEYYIHMSGRGSRFTYMGKILMLIPDSFWYLTANLIPGLFARGIIFKLRKKR